jgi:o-succinylbenzoate synthase
MGLQSAVAKKVFSFNFQARTSRGAMRERTSWFVKIWDAENPEVFGIGECAPLPGLSIDNPEDFENTLKNVLDEFTTRSIKENIQKLISLVPIAYPSIVFGIETALLDLQNGGKRAIFKNDFLAGRTIPINGLIWMADMDLMLQQIAIKIYEGYRCIKMKVGGLNFEKECDILHYVRKKYYREDIVIRLDANGAFKNDECLLKLHELAKFNVHSIEQPIKPGQLDFMQELSAKSPIPIALDEELIGVYTTKDKEKLLQQARVPYIILKPTLHGGLYACREWITLAEQSKIGWWLTSALESNVGLNAISQFTAEYPVTIPQGLGTGQLYDDNIESPLFVKEGTIGMDRTIPWSFESLNFE